MNPSAVYLQGDPNKDRLDLNGLDSPTAGYNINTRPETKARTWLLITNNEGHMTRTNQWGHDTMNMTTNQNMTHWTREPIAWRHEGKGSMTQTRTVTKFKIKDMKTRTWNRTNRPYRRTLGRMWNSVFFANKIYIYIFFFYLINRNNNQPTSWLSK